MSRLKFALLFSFLGQQGNLLIGFASIAVLARLMTPKEIGVYAVSSFIVVIATEIRSFGVNQHLIRVQEWSDQLVSSAFGIMMVACGSIAILVMVSATFVADIFSEPDIETLLYILALTFLLGPFSSIPLAELTRNMRFDVILRVMLVSSITRATVSIGLVWAGFSYFGIAWSVVVGSVVECLAIAHFGRGKLFVKPSLNGWRHLVKVGATLSVTGLITRINIGLPDIMLGRLSTMDAVGLFSRGFGLIRFLDRVVTLTVTPVVMPHLAEVQRRSGGIGIEYSRCVYLHGAVSMPVFAASAVLAEHLIPLFFGTQWDEAIPVAQTLAVWALVRSPFQFLPAALVSTNREGLLLRKELMVVLLLVIAFGILTPFGLVPVAWGVVAVAVVELIFSLWIMRRFLGVDLSTHASQTMRNLFLSAICFVGAVILDQVILPSQSALMVIACASMILPFLWLLVLVRLNHPFWDIIKATIGSFANRF